MPFARRTSATLLVARPFSIDDAAGSDSPTRRPSGRMLRRVLGALVCLALLAGCIGVSDRDVAQGRIAAPDEERAPRDRAPAERAPPRDEPAAAPDHAEPPSETPEAPPEGSVAPAPPEEAVPEETAVPDETPPPQETAPAEETPPEEAPPAQPQPPAEEPGGLPLVGDLLSP